VRIEPRRPPPPINLREWDGFIRICFGRKNKTLGSIFRQTSTLLLLARNLSQAEVSPSAMLGGSRGKWNKDGSGPQMLVDTLGLVRSGRDQCQIISCLSEAYTDTILLDLTQHRYVSECCKRPCSQDGICGVIQHFACRSSVGRCSVAHSVCAHLSSARYATSCFNP